MINIQKKILLVLVILSIVAPTGQAGTAQNSWLSEALHWQEQIDLNTPLNQATFLATHNSYNSAVYTTPLRYWDPNQQLSIYDQLESGVRSIELDVHWVRNKNFSMDMLLCHAHADHVGCSPFDRKVTEGLAEIKRWLQNHPKQVVLLYIERFLDKHESHLAALLAEMLGDFIYQPDLSQTHGACSPLPSDTLTKADILKAGKQLIVVTKGCDSNQRWNEWVFAGLGAIPQEPYAFLEEMPKRFSCGATDEYQKDANHLSMWRLYENRTVSGNIPPTKALDDQLTQKALQCGVNSLAFDKLSSNDSRLKSAIWSWAYPYPQPQQGKCALYQIAKGIINVPCETYVTAFSCRNAISQQLTILSSHASIAEGEAICAKQGLAWHFYMPVNAAQMHALMLLANQPSIASIALNYSLNENGDWVANKPAG